MPIPGFWSMAFDDIAQPDFADVSIAVLPQGAPTDPDVWAECIFSIRTMPRWIVLALGVRQLLVPLIGVSRAPRDTFAVRHVKNDEALLSFDDRHLDFRVGVGVDSATRLIRVVTVVRLKGWRGRVYFAPVRLVHPVVVRAMLKRALRELTPATQRYTVHRQG